VLHNDDSQKGSQGHDREAVVNERTQLQDAKARLAAIVEGSEDAIIAYRLDGVITDWNQAAMRLYGYSAEEAIGHNVSFLELPIDANEYQEMLKTIAAGGRFQQIEGFRQRRDGSPVAVVFSIFPITGEDGAIIGGSCIVHDITSRKRMEEQLRRSEERFRLLAQATKDALSDRDLRNEAMWRSDNFWEQFGYSRKEVEPDVGAWRELIHPEDRDRVVKGFQTALARHADSHEVEYRFRRADDSYAVVLERTYVIYGESGEPIRALSAMTDLSDRRQLEEQFRQAQKMEAVGQLAGGVAHDFNNILMVISAYTELIHTRYSSDSELQNNVAQVLNATKKAAALTYQLLAFSRKQVLVPHIIDLNIVVEDTSKMIQRVIGEDIELNVSLSEASWHVKVDPGQIVQVLMNLAVNARDAMRDGGELSIETMNVTVDVEAANRHPTLVPGDYVVLVVSDNGTGMTKEVQSHLFDPFFTTKELGRGTGLGLSTVYGIVKQSGGYIWVDSELGRGSTFTVYFPVVDAPLTRTTVTPPIVCTGGKGEIILLVEDDDCLRESISTYLDLNGYKVLAAANGAEGTVIAQQHAESIRVLVTDVVLPKLSGEKLAQEVAKISPHVLTLFISGYTDRRMVDFDPESSTVAFLQKPFALRTLVEKIAEMIVRHSASPM